MSKRSPGELEDQKRLGRILGQHRTRLNLTQSQVAEHLEVPNQLIQRLERGKATLTVPRLLKLAEIFRLAPASLLDSMSDFEAHEDAFDQLTEEEQRLLRAFHRIPDRIQRRNILDLIERMAPET